MPSLIRRLRRRLSSASASRRSFGRSSNRPKQTRQPKQSAVSTAKPIHPTFQRSDEQAKLPEELGQFISISEALHGQKMTPMSSLGCESRSFHEPSKGDEETLTDEQVKSGSQAFQLSTTTSIKAVKRTVRPIHPHVDLSYHRAFEARAEERRETFESDDDVSDRFVARNKEVVAVKVFTSTRSSHPKNSALEGTAVTPRKKIVDTSESNTGRFPSPTLKSKSCETIGHVKKAAIALLPLSVNATVSPKRIGTAAKVQPTTLIREDVSIAAQKKNVLQWKTCSSDDATSANTTTAAAANVHPKTLAQDDIVVGSTIVDIKKGRNAGKTGKVIGWMNKITLRVLLASDEDVVNVRLASVAVLMASRNQLHATHVEQTAPEASILGNEKRRVKIVAGKNKGKTGLFDSMKTKNTCKVVLDKSQEKTCVRLSSIRYLAD